MTEPAPLPRRHRRLAVRLALVLALCVLGLEFGVRWLMFGEGELAQRLGARTRQATLYAERWDDEYWRLQHTLDGTRQVIGQADPLVGWRSQVIREGKYAHRRRSKSKGRRPVLMYGDSFTAGVTAEEDCWPGLLERSELSRAMYLLNYGVGGYGVDQMLVLLRATIDRWSERDPLVIIGILVDDDLDRCTLTARTGPKPWFEIDEQGELVSHPPALADPPPIAPPEPGITSYLWRWLTRSSGFLPESWHERARGLEAHRVETQALCAALLSELQAELDSRELEHFVVLFHVRRHILREAETDWREPWLEAELDRLGIPWVSSRLALDADARATGDDPSVFFVPQGERGQNHLNPRGNEVVFRAIQRGLQGDYDGAVSAR